MLRLIKNPIVLAVAFAGTILFVKLLGLLFGGYVASSDLPKQTVGGCIKQSVEWYCKASKQKRLQADEYLFELLYPHELSLICNKDEE